MVTKIVCQINSIEDKKISPRMCMLYNLREELVEMLCFVTSV